MNLICHEFTIILLILCVILKFVIVNIKYSTVHFPTYLPKLFDQQLKKFYGNGIN